MRAEAGDLLVDVDLLGEQGHFLPNAVVIQAGGGFPQPVGELFLVGGDQARQVRRNLRHQGFHLRHALQDHGGQLVAFAGAGGGELGKRFVHQRDGAFQE